MILDDNPGDWTVTEVDPETTADPRLLKPGDALPLQPEQTRDVRPTSRIPLRSLAARTAAQTSVVLVAALIVGLLVFAAVRQLVGSDSEDQVAGGPDGDLVLTPGPDESPLQGSSRSGSRRSDTDGNGSGVLAASDSIDGDSSDDASPNGLALDDSDPGSDGDGSPAGGSSTTTDDGRPSVTSPGGPTTVAGPTLLNASTATTAQGPGSTGRTSTPSTTSGSSSTVTSGPTPSTTAVSTSVTASITSSTAPSTTRSTTTTSTTTTAPPPAALISGPADGTVQSWNTVTRFRANDYPGAATYCWTVTAVSQTSSCGSGRAFDLPARSLKPGPATVLAEAKNASGVVVASQRLNISLLATNILKEPDPGEEFRPRDRLRLRADDVPTATNHCWVITQPGYSSGDICSAEGRATLTRSDRIRRDLDEGPATIQATAFRGATLIGRQSITIEIER